MLYIVIALLIVIGVLAFFLVRQIARAKILEIKVLKLNDELQESSSEATQEFVALVRENDKLKRANERLRQEAQDRVVSIELLAGELDRAEQDALHAEGIRKAPQDRRPSQKQGRRPAKKV